MLTGKVKTAFPIPAQFYVLLQSGAKPSTGRGASAMPLGAPGQAIDVAGSIGGQPTKIRTDGFAPSRTGRIALARVIPVRR